MKGLRVAGAKTLGEANAYLEAEFIPWWNSTLVVAPASCDDAHRPVGQEHSLAASLSYVDIRQVSSDYTVQFDSRTYRIARSAIRSGLRGGHVRVEVRLDGSLAVRFGADYLPVVKCEPRPKASNPSVRTARARQKPAVPRAKSQWMKNFHLTGPEKAALSAIPAAPQVPGLQPIR